MTSEASLRAAILADPAADAPRRVLADLLQARGDPRGELIAVQCEAAGLDDEDPRRRVLDDRAEELLLGHQRGWDAELKDLPGITWRRYARGFVEDVTLAPAHAVTTIPALRARVPLRGLDLDVDVDMMEALADVAELGDLARIRLRAFRGALSDAFLRWPHRGQLRELDLALGTGADARLAVETPALAGLRRLRAHADPLDAGEVAGAAHLASLIALDLGDQEHVADGARAIAASEVLAGLEELGLDALGPGGLRALLAAPNLAGVRALRLAQLDPDDDDLAALRAADLPALRDLDLTGCRRASAAAAALAANVRPARSLRSLDLAGTELRDADVAALLASPRLRAIEDLGIDAPRVTPKIVAAIVASPARATLRTLRMTTDRNNAAALIAADLPALRELPVLTDPMVERVATARGLPSLRRLIVTGGYGVGDADARALASSPHLPALVHVVVRRGANLTADGVTALRARFGRGLELR